MDPVRQGILSRKVKSYHNRNEGNIDAEYEKEQQRLQSKKEKLENIMEHRKITFHGTTIEKKYIRTGINEEQYMYQQLNSKIKQDDKTRNRTEEYNNDYIQQKRHDEYLQRRDHMKALERKMMLDNQILAQEKQQKKLHDKYQNIQTDFEHLKRDPHKTGLDAR